MNKEPCYENAARLSPEFPDTCWSFRHALSFEGKRSAFPPLGLLTVSAMLPDAWERRLVDMNVHPLKAADIEWADLVFASAMLVQKDSLRRVVELCKAEGRRVVSGDALSHRAGARRARPSARRVLALPAPRPYPASREVRGGDEAGRGWLSLPQADRRAKWLIWETCQRQIFHYTDSDLRVGRQALHS